MKRVMESFTINGIKSNLNQSNVHVLNFFVFKPTNKISEVGYKYNSASNLLFHKFLIYIHSCILPSSTMLVSYYNLMNIIFISPLNNIFSWCFLFNIWFLLVITFHVWMKYGIMNVYVPKCLILTCSKIL